LAGQTRRRKESAGRIRGCADPAIPDKWNTDRTIIPQTARQDDGRDRFPTETGDLREQADRSSRSVDNANHVVRMRSSFSALSELRPTTTNAALPTSSPPPRTYPLPRPLPPD